MMGCYVIMFEVLIYILHGAATSPFVRKTWIFLKEKGLEFEHRQLDPLDKSERFLSMNPLGRIPVLEEADGNLISDSSVICDYLENVHPSPSLYPANNRSRAQALWFEEYADTLLTQICAQVFWMHIIIPIRSGKPADLTEIDAFCDKNYPGVFGYLESVAPDDSSIVDNQFGIADISLASTVRLLDLAGAPLDADRWPRFNDYYQRVISRPSAKSIIDEELFATEVFRTTGDAPQYQR
jgi:glutathione S-transferase